jgi:hypothetical protein
VKAASAAGLVVGTRKPGIAKLTLAALVAYFAVAVGFHVKAKDTPANTAPAALLGLVFAALLRTARTAVPAGA